MFILSKDGEVLFNNEKEDSTYQYDHLSEFRDASDNDDDTSDTQHTSLDELIKQSIELMNRRETYELDSVSLSYLPNVFIYKDKSFHVRFNYVQFEDQISLLVSLRDVTFIKELEDQKRISSFKSVILASTSHELRNPLNGILTMLDVMEPEIPHSLDESFTVARKSSNLLLFLLNDILDYSQLEAGQLKLFFDEFNPSHSI